MSERRFFAVVSTDSKLVPREPIAWVATLADLRGQEVVVSIERARKARSTQQNKYYWSCVVPIFQEVWSIARNRAGVEPLTKDETHEVLVQVLLGCEDGPVPGTRLRKRTSGMDTAAFSQYVDKCRELALHQYGFEIPNSGEEVSV